jgi:hypothetical protein
MARTTTAVVALLVMLMGACDREEAIPPLEDDGAAEASPGAPTRLIHSFTLKSYATSSRAKRPKSHGWRGRSSDGRAYVVVRETALRRRFFAPRSSRSGRPTAGRPGNSGRGGARCGRPTGASSRPSHSGRTPICSVRGEGPGDEGGGEQGLSTGPTSSPPTGPTVTARRRASQAGPRPGGRSRDG